MWLNFCDCSQEEQEALLGLTAIAGVGTGLAIRLRKTLGTAARVFQASVDELLAVPGIGKELATRLMQGPDWFQIRVWLRRMQEEGMDAWVYGSPAYPQGLKRLSTPPLRCIRRANSLMLGLH